MRTTAKPRTNPGPCGWGLIGECPCVVKGFDQELQAKTAPCPLSIATRSGIKNRPALGRPIAEELPRRDPCLGLS